MPAKQNKKISIHFSSNKYTLSYFETLGEESLIISKHEGTFQFSPMDRNVILDVINDVNEYCVIFIGVDCWSRKFTVNGNNLFRGAKSRHLLRYHLKV